MSVERGGGPFAGGHGQARLLAVLHALDDAVVAVEADGTVVLANLAARLLLDLGPDEGKGPLLDRVRLPALHDAITAALAGQAIARDCELPGPPRRRLHLRAAPMPEGGALAVLHDTTRLERLERVRRDFVANVSHELRTPVTIIKASAESLLDGALEDVEAGRAFVQAIARNADRLAALVGDLLDLGRIESGRWALARMPLPLRSAAVAAVQSLAPAAAAADLRVQIDVAPELIAYADARATEQVLVNLLQNAIRHSPRGAAIQIRGREEGGSLALEVRDFGPGVPAALRERLFERFYRLDAGRGRDHEGGEVGIRAALGGSGLGLAIARHLVAAMGGEIGVNEPSDGGAGSSFAFTLPRYESVLAHPFGSAMPDGGRGEGATAANEPPRRRPLRARTATELGAVEAQQDGAIGGAALAEETMSAEARILALRPEVQELRRQLLRMAGRVEEMIGNSVRAIVLHDLDLALRTISSDDAVNRDELAADALCLRLLSQPEGARDAVELRFVTRALKMVTDLERIADLAVNICERAPLLLERGWLGEADTIEAMAGHVQTMVRDAMDAFVAADVALAVAVIERDEEVDALYHALSRRLIAAMATDAQRVEAGIHLQAVAKFLERIGDHATNLGEQVIFMARGDEVRHAGVRT